jgi:hypothetical protein
MRQYTQKINPTTDSFDEAMVLWLDDRLPNESFHRQRQWMLATLLI